MKHILFLISRDDKTVGGSEEVLRLIANYYLDNGDDVHLFFLKEKLGGLWESVKRPNLHLYYSAGGGKRGIFSIVHNFRKVKDIKFDYSYSCIVLENAIIGLLQRLGIINVDHIVMRESTLVFQRFTGIGLFWRKLLYKVGYKPASLVICQTNQMKNEFLDNLPWMRKKKRVEVVPNPISIEEIKEKEKENIDLSSYGNYIVAAGRLIAEKGFDLLIQSLTSIKEPNDIKLLILGDGQERTALSDLAQELHLKDRVVLCGRVPNVFPYFKQARLCVVSSRVEGFPNVLLQMMSQNVNVVSTQCFGDIDLVDGVVTCAPNDQLALVQAMNKCLMADNRENRIVFDQQLSNVSIDNFVKTVQGFCE